MMRTTSTTATGAWLALALGGCRAPDASAANPEAHPAAVASPTPEAARARYTYSREYRPGEVLRYRIVRSYFENGELKRTEDATSVHTVVPGSPPYEEITFERLSTVQGGEERDLSEEIARFPAYRVSIAKSAPAGSLDAPSLAGWSMDVVGIVTDLHTFLVAISPQAGIEHVSRAGESHVFPEPVVASWANGADIPVGQDCIVITVTLQELRETTAVLETRFTPPEARCLEPLSPAMADPIVSGTPNNFQQKMRMGEQFGAMWGREQFVVVSEIRRSDGVVLKATMENELQLRMMLACSETLEACQHEMPLTLRRELTLRLVDEQPP